MCLASGAISPAQDAKRLAPPTTIAVHVKMRELQDRYCMRIEWIRMRVLTEMREHYLKLHVIWATPLGNAEDYAVHGISFHAMSVLCATFCAVSLYHTLTTKASALLGRGMICHERAFASMCQKVRRQRL
jgi:hypothetical protein